MASAIRTLEAKVNADTKNFEKGMRSASNSTETFGSKVGNVAKNAAKSLALVGVAAAGLAIKIGVDSVKAAIEDEKSQRLLAIQLRKTVNANQQVTDSVEAYISRTQLRVGIQDDKLRPSLARLVRSTNDVSKAQDLLNLAIDISTSTGKPLEAVANALGKSYDGNSQALGRLGLGIDTSILKSKDFTVVNDALKKSFGGFADEEAKSFDGSLRILNVRIDELKEGFGKKLLPFVLEFIAKLTEVVAGLSGDTASGFAGGIRNAREEISKKTDGYSLGESLGNVARSFGDLFKAVTAKDGQESVSTLQSIADSLNAIAGGIRAVGDAYTATKGFREFITTSPFQRLFQPGVGVFGGSQRAIGGPVTAGTQYLVGEYGPELFTAGQGSITPNNRLGNGSPVVINLNGIVDAASARRSIERVLQTQSRISGPISLTGAMS